MSGLSATQSRRAGRLLLVAVRVDVLAPLRIAGDYRIGIGVTATGRSSVTYRYAVFAGDECVATGASVSVYLGEDGPAPLPDELREQLGRHRIDGPAAGLPDRDVIRPREAYPFRVDVRTRFGDLDTNRHVNNVRLAGWYLDGLAELHLDVLGYPIGGPLDGLAPRASPSPTSTRCTTRASSSCGSAWSTSTTTWCYACGLFDEGRCVGTAEATGTFRATDAQGEAVDLATTLEPFRLRG